ncbi:hypothetical protein QBC44DRAFT_336811 [Cladorrhinum sp. PSN332]|nr:hypothetical protein QBC44DRAFT_336811 [Cladorrhinum sp. PSN332]
MASHPGAWRSKARGAWSNRAREKQCDDLDDDWRAAGRGRLDDGQIHDSRVITGCRGSSSSWGSARRPGWGSATARGGRICRFFLQDKCTHGSGCNFSHDINSTPMEPAANPSSEEGLAGQAEYLGFKRSLRSQGWIGLREISTTWQRATKILNSPTREWHQSIAKDLADDAMGGPVFVRQSIRLLGASDDEPTQRLDATQAFLAFITNPSLLRSLSIDAYVGTVYRLIAGVDGDDAVCFFRHTCHMLNPGLSSPDPRALLGHTLAALHELLRRERKILLNDDLPDLLTALEAKAAELAPSPTLDLVSLQLDAVLRMAQSARARLDKNGLLSNGTTVEGPVCSTFPADLVIPGGKHDNDHADATQIEIFPTPGEISSTFVEYLPVTDLSQPSFLLDPVERHLDAAFRLLRHDIFGPLKETIGNLLEQHDVLKAASPAPFVGHNTRAHAYARATLEQVFIDPKFGLEAVLSFSQPRQVRRLSFAEQRHWWKESARLDSGGLVCLLSEANESEQGLLLLIVTQKSTDDHAQRRCMSSLVSESNPSVTVKLACETRENVHLLNRLFVEKRHGILVDFPGLIPDTFLPVLRNLQRMMNDGHFAFQRWIVPKVSSSRHDQESGTSRTDIPPPIYAREPGFCFRFDSISKEGHSGLTLDPTSPSSLNLQVLEDATGLDRGQCDGLVAALTREYALIQGPPGTGKSYLGVQLVRVLLDRKAEAGLGPILIICYTNHALDQFLKHLVDVGIDKVIRIGGQSKAEDLAGKNLRVVSKDVRKTRVENGLLAQSYSERESLYALAQGGLGRIQQARKGRLSWKTLKEYLSKERPEIAGQYGLTDHEGFTLVGKDPFEVWLQRDDTVHSKLANLGAEFDLQELALRAEKDVYSLSFGERWALAKSWFSQMIEMESGDICDLLEEAKKPQRAIDGIHANVNIQALSRADVVGITTTGLARNIDMLRCLGSKVIIAEEAAEVQEPHILNALIPGTEHFIQIGDHCQLRPKIQNHQFSLETPAGRLYQLDRSQFERRAMGQAGLAPLPLAQLSVQRRMRPDISRLIRTVYPQLQNHESVVNLPSVTGMRKDLFWWDHCGPESSDDNLRVKSHSNPWEVEMGVALVRHLVRQGESGADIALLTPYTKQLQEFRLALSRDFEVFLSARDQEALVNDGFDPDLGDSQPEGARPKMVEKTALISKIRLASIDNFQGEEAAVVLVSLVRSNGDSKVGFLSTTNRVNVMLSRAKRGLYIIGNKQTYQNVNGIWTDVINQLENTDAVGPAIELCCPRHPDTPISCSDPDQFILKSPEGGCLLPCDRRLDPCGHRCEAPCHSLALHEAFSCLQPCPRIRSTCTHLCPKPCGVECGQCRVKLNGVGLPCGHTMDNVLCYQTLDLAKIRCSRMVEKVVPRCQHAVTVSCHRDVTSPLFSCSTKCGQGLDCGHPCPGVCKACRQQDEDGLISLVHQACTRPCSRPSPTCNHLCGLACHKDTACGSCAKPCEVQCSHSRCRQECSKPCSPCIEKCTWSCEHQGGCSLPCAAPCDRLPCDKRCALLLKCNHQCPSFCGEECPQHLCQVCCTQDLKDSRVDLLEFNTFGDIDLDESPIVMLGCSHFFTGESLDCMLRMTDVYSVDKAGRYDGLFEPSGEISAAVPACPDCRVPIQQFSVKRYNRVVNRAVMDETVKRFLVNGSRTLETLRNRLTAFTAELSASRQELINDPSSIPKAWDRLERATNGFAISREIGQLCRDHRLEHQPWKKLLDAIFSFQSLNHNQTNRQIDQGMANLTVQGRDGQAPARMLRRPTYNEQVLYEAWALYTQAQDAIIHDEFCLMELERKGRLNPPGSRTVRRVNVRVIATKVFKECINFMPALRRMKLYRAVIRASLTFARVGQIVLWYQRNGLFKSSPDDTDTANPGSSFDDKPQPVKDQDISETAKQFLTHALELCESHDVVKAHREEVEMALGLFADTRYEEVTPREIEDIKSAMVSGSGGIATHSGHWYNCENGHPFAIGECGMPMEEARCPECGSRIGGQNHMPVSGMTRATNME